MGDGWEDWENKHRVTWRASYNLRIVECVEVCGTSCFTSTCIISGDPHNNLLTRASQARVLLLIKVY